MISSKFWILSALTCLAPMTMASGATYYFDADGGSDSFSGISPETAWATLSMIDNQTFQPGDQILLQRGDFFTGKIYLNGDSGTVENPIVVGAYGTGADPVISCIGYRAGVHIRNAEYIEVSDLEITGDGGAMVDGAPNNKRYGVLIDASGTNAYFRGITIRNLFIHDIFPRDSDESEGATPNPEWVAGGSNKKKAITWYGTGLSMRGVNGAVSSNILVEDCRIETMGYKAIEMARVEFVELLNNYAADIGGPALQPSNVKDLVVRGNVVNGSGAYTDPRMHGRGSGIWPWGSDRVLIEKNTFMHARGRADSCGIHIDFNCNDVIIQHNLSIDNGGGFIEILGNNYNCTYRYNISINDGSRVKGEPSNGPGTLPNNQDGHILWVSGFVGSGNPGNGPFNQYIYNNTIFVKSDIKGTFSIQDTALGLLVANNIFYVEGATEDITGDYADNYDQNMVDHVVWKNNLYQRTGIVPTFYKNTLADPSFTDTDQKIGDPLFANTGGLAAADYFPAAIDLIEDKGILIEKLPGDAIGLKVGLALGEDFFGNPIVGLPDMGAIEIGGAQPPLPPAAFASAPTFLGESAASMSSVVGPYNTTYYFTETSGNFGGDDSGWQLDPSYVDVGLLPNTTYTYTVTLRDAVAVSGSASAEASVYISKNQPFEDPVILLEDFSSVPNPANTIDPYPVEIWFVGSDVEEQDGSVNSSSGQLRIGWGFDTVSVHWLADRLWNTTRDYRFTGDWEIENVLDVHLGLLVGVGEFHPDTGDLLQRVKEVTVGELGSPVIGQTGTITIEISSAELDLAGVLSSNRIGIYFEHVGAYAPSRNDVYLVDNLELSLLGGDADSDSDGIPDSVEPGLGLNPYNNADGAEDLDLDGQSNFAEFLTGTDLNDSADFFNVQIELQSGQPQLLLSGSSILDGRLYILEHSTTIDSWAAVDAVDGTQAGPGEEHSFSFTNLGERNFFRVRVEWE